MALTISYSFTDGPIIESAKVNANFTDIKNFVDALQAGTNFTAQAIQTAAIADASVTLAKMSAGVIKQGDDDQMVLGGQVFG